jgi:hypothetical protein
MFQISARDERELIDCGLHKRAGIRMDCFAMPGAGKVYLGRG